MVCGVLRSGGGGKVNGLAGHTRVVRHRRPAGPDSAGADAVSHWREPHARTATRRRPPPVPARPGAVDRRRRRDAGGVGRVVALGTGRPLSPRAPVRHSQAPRPADHVHPHINNASRSAGRIRLGLV